MVRQIKVFERVNEVFSPEDLVKVSPYRCGVLQETSDYFSWVNDKYCAYLGWSISQRRLEVGRVTYCVGEPFVVYVGHVLLV